jgi:hypothetical protein
VSESVDESLRDRIRARVADGRLPVLSGSAGAGKAPGDHRCVCCHRTIRATTIEYEPRDHHARAPGVFRDRAVGVAVSDCQVGAALR